MRWRSVRPVCEISRRAVARRSRVRQTAAQAPHATRRSGPRAGRRSARRGERQPKVLPHCTARPQGSRPARRPRLGYRPPATRVISQRPRTPLGAAPRRSVRTRNCPLPSPAPIAMTLPSSCTILRVDTAPIRMRTTLGRRYACADDSRVSNPQPAATPSRPHPGPPQGNSAYRKLTVYDGDSYSGEPSRAGLQRWDGGLATPNDAIRHLLQLLRGGPPDHLLQRAAARQRSRSTPPHGRRRPDEAGRAERLDPSRSRSCPSAPITASGASGTRRTRARRTPAVGDPGQEERLDADQGGRLLLPVLRPRLGPVLR